VSPEIFVMPSRHINQNIETLYLEHKKILKKTQTFIGSKLYYIIIGFEINLSIN